MSAQNLLVNKDEVIVTKRDTTEILLSFKTLGVLNPLDRIPDMDLIEDVVEFSKESSLANKIVDTVSIYRGLFEMRSSLSPAQKSKCDKIIDEIEKSLHFYLDHNTLPERKLRVKGIFRTKEDVVESLVEN